MFFFYLFFGAVNAFFAAINAVAFALYGTSAAVILGLFATLLATVGFGCAYLLRGER